MFDDYVFMLTTSISNPMAINISKPDESLNDFQEIVPDSRFTILPGKKNKIAWYMDEVGKVGR